MSEPEDLGFTVRDRRGLETADDGAGSEPSTEPSPETPAGEPAPQDMPAIDFSTFVLSLSTSAMLHLGEGPSDEGAPEVNLPMARQVVDILAVLQAKTTGNLTAEEERLLEQLLYDLRLRYVNAANSQ